jgi:alpha 1,3-glucosidase
MARRWVWLWPVALVATLVLLTEFVDAVKRQDFKTCSQSGFCRRTRALADRQESHKSKWQSPYSLTSPKFDSGVYRADVANALFPDIQFSLEIRFHSDGVARVLVDQVRGLRQRYNESAIWALKHDPTIETDKNAFHVQIGGDESVIKYAHGRHEVHVAHDPILVTFYRDSQPQVVLNERGLLNLEHFRTKPVEAQVGEAPDLLVQDSAAVEEHMKEEPNTHFPYFLDENEEGMWEESFGGRTDTKPKGTYQPPPLPIFVVKLILV